VIGDTGTVADCVLAKVGSCIAGSMGKAHVLASRLQGVATHGSGICLREAIGLQDSMPSFDAYLTRPVALAPGILSDADLP
jgi:hypothetical protein